MPLASRRAVAHRSPRGKANLSPIDWECVEYIAFEGDWKLKLAKELSVAGFAVDLDKA